MLKGIYFLETNSGILSDMEGCFTINDAFSYKGGCGVIREAVKQLNQMDGVDFIVISERLIDGDCEEALRQLENIQAQKIVATSTKDEILKMRLSKKARLLPFPYTYDELDELLKKICGSSTYGEGEIEQIAESAVARSVDNPFSAGREEPAPEPVPEPPKRVSFQERLKNVQFHQTSQREDRLFSQKTVVVCNQKGGVGKSTITKELAIALTCLSIQKGEQLYQPKVCLCDLDLDSSDMASLLNLPAEPNIKHWAEDIEKQAAREKKKAETIRFTEWDIKQNYLQKHDSGLYILTAPENKTDGLQVSREVIIAVLENLRLCNFDIVIVDTGSNIFDYTIAAILKATVILALSTCDVVSAKRIDGVLEDILLGIDGFDKSKMKLVINKYDAAFNISPEEIAGVLKIPLIAVIPDCREITNVNNSGNSVFYGSSKAAAKQQNFADAVRRLAKQLLEIAPGHEAADVGKEEKGKGIFGRLFLRNS